MLYVCGHQNPDTDSIVAAVSYAALRADDGAVAVRLGELSPETSFVLKRFGFEPPAVIQTARTQLSDIDYDRQVTVTPDTSVIEAWKLMKENGIITLVVADSEGKLLGLVSPGDIADKTLTMLTDMRDMDVISTKDLPLLSNGYRVGDIMSSAGLIAFKPEHFVDDVLAQMLSTRYRSYPVADEDGRVCGSVSRFHLIRHKRKRFVLVDHNEKSQSVPGLEQADITEIIDHHRLGDIQTGSPVYFRNEPVGSATTIIAGMFGEAGKTPEPKLAGLMLAGILSDTVLYKSPTCTEKDRRMAAWLAGIAGVDDMKLGRELFAAFDAELLSHTCEQIFFYDFKEYALGGKKIGVGQITVWESVGIPSDEIQEFMGTLLKRERFDLLLFMQTEIVGGGTLFLYACETKDLLRRTFDIEPDGKPFFKSGVMSRKKQVVPALRAELV